MKKTYLLITITSIGLSLLLPSCKARNGGVWDESKTAGNYKNGAFFGEEGDVAAEGLIGPADEDFVPLKEEDLKAQFADGAIPQPKMSPGEEGSGLPGIDHFRDPKGTLASIFRTLYFNTDDHILRGKEALAAVDRIAGYLKEHPDMYVFIEGHCDERGPEAYNLSLGARRANYVRTLLVKKGVDLNQIHTISYGKEQPADQRHIADAWSKNRRAQFKVYER